MRRTRWRAYAIAPNACESRWYSARRSRVYAISLGRAVEADVVARRVPGLSRANARTRARVSSSYPRIGVSGPTP